MVVDKLVDLFEGVGVELVDVVFFGGVVVEVVEDGWVV